MLRIGLIALLALAAPAFAGLENLGTSLEGKGEWRMPNGSKGTWTSVMTVDQAEKGMTIKEVLTIQTPEQTDHVEEMTWSFIKKEHGFFDIAIGDKVTGWGHCFGHVCQINSAGKEPNSRWTETLKITKRGVLRIGTDHTDQYQVSWRGVLKKK